ncbi:MAG TPA: phosphatidylserine decarboxylase [bacterium]|nr:phosphatidylserine decarboxylase [bacterium]
MKYSIDPRAYPGAAVLGCVVLLISFLWPQITSLAVLLLACHFLFFRDPQPLILAGDSPVSPAEGKVVEISYQAENRYLKEECVKIGICLSLWNAHVNRSPIKGIVKYLEYVPGKFMNALNQASVPRNESNWLGIENGSKRVLVRQMVGALARRVFCDATLETRLERGQKFGIICYGSRVEFFAPKKEFRPFIRVGDPVKAGQTILGEWIS